MLFRSVAYLAQTLMQSIHISQHEYCEAFGSDGWRQSIRNSVNGNTDYLYPPAPAPEQPATSAPASERSASPQPQPQPTQAPVNCHSDAVAQTGIHPDRVGSPARAA